ncbi:terminase small subunit-like protein|uniref:terminase small subunit-like protein n=1 Tax=Rhizobium altiplani TaxID=1864509 RepID=UPI00315ACA91
MADAICERLSNGESLRAICLAGDMPNTNGIVLPQMPAHFALGVWMLPESEKLGNIKFKFRARMLGTRQISCQSTVRWRL